MMMSSGIPTRGIQKLLRLAQIVPLFVVAPVVSAAATPYAQFTSGVNLVEVYATVTDRRGEPVPGLTAADFDVAEDGANQRISAFAAGEFPLAVAIGLDHSFSMAGSGNRLAVAKSAARTFIAALRPDDQVMVVAIGGDTDVVARLSSDRAAALAAVDRLDAWGTTPLYDATLIAIDAIQSVRGRRALVLLSDGSDRYSETGAADLVDRARRRDVLIYPIALGSTRPPVFAELAAATGGRSFFARDPASLAATMATIARELRFQYLLGYAPLRGASTDGSWHAIDVTVKRPDVRVRARDGYVSR
jgi:Ca-activated chloride channel family protein